MNKKLMIKAALIALTAALIAPAALAGHKHRVVRQQTPRLDVLAYQLREESREVRAEALFRARTQRGHRGPDRIDGRLIGSLTDLERQADRFSLAVDRRDPRRVEREYVRLVRAFDRAALEVDRIRSQRVRMEFRDVAFVMDRVNQRVALAAGYGPRAVPYRDGVHGSVVFGDVIGDARFRVRIDW